MSRDPYRYFRVEAAELHERLSQGLLDLEEEPRSERVLDLLRAAHTLKGAARVVGLDVAARASHTLEDQLAAWRDGDRMEGLQPLFGTLDEIAAELRRLPDAGGVIPPSTLETPTTAGPRELPTGAPGLKARPPAPRPAPRGDQLEELMDRALTVTARIVRSRRRLVTRDPVGQAPGTLAGTLKTDLAATVDDELEAAVRELGALRQAVEDLRLTPAAELLHFLRRAARDVAQAQGKRVVVEIRGKEARFDADLAAALRDPLLHAVTNAVTHGVAAGGQGRITISGQREGSMVVFRIVDDGPGLDLEALRRRARTAGVLGAEEGEDWPPEQVVQLAFRPGVSTVTAVDHLSGRGIGLDALRQSVVALQGDARFLLGEGPGTTLEIRVPFSTYAVPALHATACGRHVALPLHSVVELVRLSPEASHGEELVLKDRAVPLGSLRRALKLDVAAGEYTVAVVLRHGQQEVALAVDRVHETAELAVFPLPPWTGPVPAMSGIGRGHGGEAIPMLSVQHLVDALSATPGIDARHIEQRRLPVLVVDDSLTSRMLQQSILEAAGFEVETAASPAEGLLRLAHRRFGLLLVDIEMPGMDGFTFLERTRDTADPVPAMVISSRSGAEDRQRGLQAGASAYVVKGQFDQPRFLQLVGELIRCS